MTLNDDDIRDSAAKEQLIAPFDEKFLRNCRYYLSAGKVFSPESGHEELLDSISTTNHGVTTTSKPVHWCIEPSDTIVVMTKEIVKIPPRLFATYGPLNHLARQGLLLVNASIIEPGYQGHLSCYFVNFSKNSIRIAPDDPIAKICFHTLTKVPGNLVPEAITEAEYVKSLSIAASSYPKSFLNIGSIEGRIADITTKSVNNSLKFGGIILLLLVGFNTLEPFFTKMIWDRAGVVSSSSHAEIDKIKAELEAQRKELQDERKNMENQDKLNQANYKNRMLELETQIKKGKSQ